MIRCYIALGANLNEPQRQLDTAVAALKALPDSRWQGCSSYYRSLPMGPQEQPDYINAVAAIDTTLPPLTLLDALQKIEKDNGRVRKDERWGPRTLDLDLLLYGDQEINEVRLTVPHYGMRDRNFVLYPLYELAPTLSLPDGTTLGQLVAKCSVTGLQRLTD